MKTFLYKLNRWFSIFWNWLSVLVSAGYRFEEWFARHKLQTANGKRGRSIHSELGISEVERKVHLELGRHFGLRVIRRVYVAIAKGVGKLVDLLYPPHCTVCSVECRGGVFLCPECEKSVVRLGQHGCFQCSRPLLNAFGHGYSMRCGDCLERKPFFACVVVAQHAMGVVREVIHQFKYNHRPYLAVLLGHWMAERVAVDPRVNGGIGPPVELLIPVPLHWWKKWQRGYNQAELLAEQVSKELGIPLETRGLRRVRFTGSQTRLHRGDRLTNLRGAFIVRDRTKVEGRHVLLVDDVLTTGATLDACAKALLKAGAASVRGTTAARG